MDIFYYVVIFAILAVVIILMIGLGGFARDKDGEFNRKYANKLMRWRIIAQAVAVVLILIYVALRQGGVG